jgi:hypothetical protein
MRKVAFVGCGGISSWAIKHFSEIIDIFEKKDNIYVKLFDDDEVEEKNLLRNSQNFEVDDLMEQKAEQLGKRYNFDFEVAFIDEENINELEVFDDIIVGVDNHKARRMLYKYAIDNNKFLLDMRAQGTQLCYIIVDGSKDIEYYDKKYFNNADMMERKGSCQRVEDIENDNIQNGNKIIAYMGMYGIYLKHLRDEPVNCMEWEFVY